ncbi:unnamed protein product [Phaedon cochleariae]|uniref:Hepatocyte growth factor-regulated tyrosine kinase substrate n=1 Tax=Phaedon cochleariae TaxID=80249 RepID=A0A9P0DUW5_PHACE|nr:unnamed protein product [Phaedon cochleariae]
MSIFRSTGNFDKLLDKATSHLLMDPDWVSTLQICDLIRQDDVQPKYALNALKKKLTSPNPYSALYALLVVESIVKNCGSVVHEELTSKVFCDFLHELAKTTPHDNVRSKLLELIQAWNFAFRKNPKHGALKDMMAAMKAEGYKFPVLRESDAMFAADTAPEWADGDVCHRCRVQFSLMQRKHHCRACGQVFCSQCTSKTSTLPKYGIEKEVRVCDSCFDEASKPSAASKAALLKQESELPAEYLKSPLAQQNQEPPKKTDAELAEEEEFQLALALSQSEAEVKEKDKYKMNSTISYNVKEPTPVEHRPPTPPPEEAANPELARYLDRRYWESLQAETAPAERGGAAPPSAPAPAPKVATHSEAPAHGKERENGVMGENDLEEFMRTLKGNVETFVNRMKSNSSRGRSIVNDTNVQSLFMNITAMHSRLLHHIQEHDDQRLHFERLQDRLTQARDARAALDALRDEHREKLKRDAEEAERRKQMQMAYKLEVMRKKKQEYLQYQRELAIQRVQEQEREMHIRQEYMKYGGQVGYVGSPAHAGQYSLPQQAAQGGGQPGSGPYNAFMFAPPPPHVMGQQQQMGQQQMGLGGGPTHGALPPQQPPHNPAHAVPPQGYHPGLQNVNPGANLSDRPQPHFGMPPGIPLSSLPAHLPGMPQNAPQHGMVPAPGGQPPSQGVPQPTHNMAPQNQGMPQQGQMHNQVMPNQVMPHPGMPQQGQMAPHLPQGGAPPTSPQAQQNGEARTAELISFD